MARLWPVLADTSPTRLTLPTTARNREIKPPKCPTTFGSSLIDPYPRVGKRR